MNIDRRGLIAGAAAIVALLAWPASVEAQNARRMILFGKSAAAWNPLNASGLIAWWDAQSLSSTPVSAWTDRKSGIAATQASGPSQPTWSATARNSKPGVTCNGTSGNLAFTPTLMPAGSNASTVAVAAFISTLNSTALAFGWGNNAAGVDRKFGMTNLNVGGFFINGTTQSVAETFTSTDRFMVSVLPAGTNPTNSIFVDGGSAETQAFSTLGTIANLGAICGGIPAGSGTFMAGSVQQIVVFSTAISTATRQCLEGWESWYDGKAGSNLPSNHRFKSRAPNTADAC